MGKDDSWARITFRKPWAREISVAAWSVAAIGIGLRVVLLGWEVINDVLAAWLLFMALVAHGLAWLPRVTVTESGFELCNGEKTHYIPFGAVEDVENRYRVVITARGRRYVSKVGVMPGKVAVGAGPDNEDPITSAWLNGRFARSGRETRVTTRFNYALVVVSVGCLIWYFTRFDV